MSEAKSKSPIRRVALAFVVIAAVGGAGYYYWRYDGLDLSKFWARASVTLTLQGNVEVRQVDLGFKVAGRIDKLDVDEGVAVKEGETLASLEKVYFEDALAEARAARDQAAANYAKMKAGNRPEDIAEAEATLTLNQATLQNATQTLDRAQALLSTQSGTIKSYDDALAAQREARARVNVASHALDLMKAGSRVEDIDAAAAALAQQEAAAKIAERQLADSDLIAPSDGVIESRAREAGAIVAVGETVFVESLTRPVWVRTYVSEPDLARIRPGMEVEVKTDDPVIPTVKGEIGFISTEAEFTPKTVETRELRTALVYRLRVVVDNGGGALRQGMPVEVIVPETEKP
ncbi:MAG: efflux RND transporter periplasmic adaptor subunit [Roseiarcus sp.]